MASSIWVRAARLRKQANGYLYKASGRQINEESGIYEVGVRDADVSCGSFSLDLGGTTQRSSCITMKIPNTGAMNHVGTALSVAAGSSGGRSQAAGPSVIAIVMRKERRDAQRLGARRWEVKGWRCELRIADPAVGSIDG